MCKKKTSKAKLILAKEKFTKREVIEVTHVTVPHLETLAIKYLETLAASDPIHERLESLL